MIRAFRQIIFGAFLVAIILVPNVLSQTTLPAPKQEKLLNGLKVLMWQDSKADKVSIKIRIHSGSAFDPQGKEGLMQMLANNLFPNAAQRDFFREDLGGDLQIETNYDYIQINASSKPESFVTMLETVSTAVSNPSIDKETTANLRAEMLAKLAIVEDEPAYIADKAVAKRLFGTFPYGRPQNGTSDSIKNIGFADLVDAKNRFLTADNATLTVSGNFDKTSGLRAIRRHLGGWIKSDKKIPATFRQPDDPPAGVQFIASPKPGISAIRFAVRSTSRSSKDFAASCVFASMLYARLTARVPAAFTSNVFVRNEQYFLPGMLMISFSAGKNDLGLGNGKIEASELVSKAISDTVTEAEFKSAKTENANRWNFRSADMYWLDNETYKTTSVDADRLVFDNVTIADVRAYADGVKVLPMVSVLVNTPAKN